MTDYTLHTVVDTNDVLIVRLTPPDGGEMQSTRIAFLPGGYIVIHGDLCPGGNGLISNSGYGVAWFAYGGRRLTPSYMAETFRVPTVFIPAQAASALREAASEEQDADRIVMLTDLAEFAETINPDDAARVDDFLNDAAQDSPDWSESFYGPDPDIMDLLVEIQAAFARLYVAKEGA